MLINFGYFGFKDDTLATNFISNQFLYEFYFDLKFRCYIIAENQFYRQLILRSILIEMIASPKIEKLENIIIISC
jgi:hypothetical protein